MKTLLSTVAAIFLIASPAQAWWECGHHIVAVLAFDLLDEAEQTELLRILEDHPRYAADFTPNDKIRDVTRWRVGVTGYWPDIARRLPEYNRPTWHYQLGSTRTIGNANVPETPGPLPTTANLDTQELHVVQALKLCFNVLSNHNESDANRALAICWLAHLVGDLHQPCHAGSLYVEGVFPDGDRGANSIKVKQQKNLHALWDSLLGQRFDEGDVDRRLSEIVDDEQLVDYGRKAVGQSMLAAVWVIESRIAARQNVYTPEVMAPIEAVSRGLSDNVGTIDLSDAYLKNAGRAARVRVIQAGYRLAEVWRLGLAE